LKARDGFERSSWTEKSTGRQTKEYCVSIIMEGGDLEVDDLFGDTGGLVDASLDAALAGTSLDPTHPVQVPVRGLPQLVDGLHLSGCRQ
jgi:hypothetical protein